MHIKDMAIFLPKAIVSRFLNMGRAEINNELRVNILENGLYYFAKDKETADTLVDKQYLKPEKRIIKPCVRFFGGMPNIEQYMQSSEVEQNGNPYLNPKMIIYAIKVNPTKEEELANYRVRGFSDNNAILYEGYCVLPKEEISQVFLVPDLVRDSEGKPVKNKLTGKFEVKFREATSEEIEQGGNTNKEYLQFMEEEKKRIGYLPEDEKRHKSVNRILTELQFCSTGVKMTGQTIKSVLAQILHRKKGQEKRTEPYISIDEVLRDYTRDKKNPYRCHYFAEAAATFLKDGFEQLDFKQELQNLTTSDIGDYFRKKYRQIDKKPIIPRGIHGINHNHRVAILAMLIAQNEGVFQEDDDNRKKDILLTAAYYHDIGRKKGIITDNWGTHAENSVRKVENMNLKHANGEQYTDEDIKILKAVIRAHEGFDNEMDGVCDRFEIDQSKWEEVKKLMGILKDADALDRVRTDINLPILMRTDLKPRYLRTDASKRLLDASYQLEEVVRYMEFDRVLEYKMPGAKQLFLDRIRGKKHFGRGIQVHNNTPSVSNRSFGYEIQI